MRSAPENMEIAVVTSDRDLQAIERLPVPGNRWIVNERTSVYYTSTNRPIALLRSWLSARRWRPDVIYLNSFFAPGFSIFVQLLARFHWWRGATLVMMPSGQLNPGALDIKSGKKALYLSLYRRFHFVNHVLWHASSNDEVANIAKVFHVQQILVRENESLLPECANPPATAATKTLRAVFLARISRIKGLDVILNALCASSHPVVLDVYGPEEDPAYLKECRAIAALTPGKVTVNFLGAVKTTDVRRVISAYDLFLLPTGGENFSHGIAEALSVSCPVM